MRSRVITPLSLFFLKFLSFGYRFRVHLLFFVKIVRFHTLHDYAESLRELHVAFFQYFVLLLEIL